MAMHCGSIAEAPGISMDDNEDLTPFSPLIVTSGGIRVCVVSAD